MAHPSGKLGHTPDQASPARDAFEASGLYYAQVHPPMERQIYHYLALFRIQKFSFFLEGTAQVNKVYTPYLCVHNYLVLGTHSGSGPCVSTKVPTATSQITYNGH